MAGKHQAPERFVSAHPQMANLPDIYVLLKIFSSEYRLYACGKIFRTPWSQPNLPICGRTLVKDETPGGASHGKLLLLWPVDPW